MKKFALFLPFVMAFIANPAQAQTEEQPKIEGQLCVNINNGKNTRFDCQNISGDKTVSELYSMGYKVVSSFSTNQRLFYIVIEKQS